MRQAVLPLIVDPSLKTIEAIVGNNFWYESVAIAQNRYQIVAI